MEFMEMVSLLIIDDLGMRKRPVTAAEELAGRSSCDTKNAPARC
jgi:hypothetical protein